MLDAIIEGGLIVDGTGAPAREGAVGLRGGRLVLDVAGEAAARRIDASGLMVAPGFIDVHTHYDAQVQWDPALSPSPLHGVTSVFGGNCGFSLAPVSEDNADYLLRMLAMVEGMPLDALRLAVRAPWAAFGDWLDHLEGKVGVNVGFMVGHSTIRLHVMGERARTDPATASDLSAMQALLGESLAGGGIGFSTSRIAAHVDDLRRPVPSRMALDEELVELSRVLRDHPGTQLEMVMQGATEGFSEREIALAAQMSKVADRPLNWNVLGINPHRSDFYLQQLAAMDRMTSLGGRIVALTLPYERGRRYSFGANSGAFTLVPGWAEVLEQPAAELIEALRRPEVRARLRAGAATAKPGTATARATQWSTLTVDKAGTPGLQRLVGRNIGEVAAERGQDPFDCVLDLVVEDQLGLVFRAEDDTTREVWRTRAEVWKDPRTLVGASDAGAHMDLQCAAAYTTTMLAQSVRELGVLTMEEAVRLLTDAPARLYGLRERGHIAEGWHADLAIFDPARIGATEETVRHDLPGGSSRMYVEATGMRHVFVNGVEVVRDDALTGNLGGKVLRSGRDTATVTAAAPAP